MRKTLTKKEKLRRKRARHATTKKAITKKARTSRRKQIAVWSMQVRSLGVCAMCPATAYIQAHHILPKEHYPEHATNIINGICLCPSHHKYGKFSAHKNPIWFTLWLRENYPEKFLWAKANL